MPNCSALPGGAYGYRTREERERTVAFLFSYAQARRADAERRWSLLSDYYGGRHRTQLEIGESCREAGIPFIPAVCPDPYLHVESQITPDLPSFEFRGRDGGADAARARRREYVVRYILDASGAAGQAAAADRRCILTGTSAWKVYWDAQAGEDGDVRVAAVDPACLYPDPAARRLSDCEFLDYAYALHRRRFIRLFGAAARARGLDPETLGQPEADGPVRAEFYDPADDTVTVVEHWYRDDDGDIACSMQAGGAELSHIDKYWRRTGGRNREYPFVLQYRVADPDGIWGHGDLEPILGLVDAVDRELSAAQLSGAFFGSDIVLAEQDAFAAEPDNRPGAIWRLKPGATGKVARLGGLGDPGNRLDMIGALRAMIQEAVGNYDVDRGKEPSRVLSATGLAQLIERAEARRASKKTERLAAFSRLLALTDWSALEFYDAQRLRALGAPPAGEREGDDGFPAVDYAVSTGDGLQKSRAFTLSVLESLLSHSLTRENYPLAAGIVRILDLPEGQALEEHLRAVFGDDGGETPPERKVKHGTH